MLTVLVKHFKITRKGKKNQKLDGRHPAERQHPSEYVPQGLEPNEYHAVVRGAQTSCTQPT
jgi:hypothetical protein